MYEYGRNATISTTIKINHMRKISSNCMFEEVENFQCIFVEESSLL